MSLKSIFVASALFTTVLAGNVFGQTSDTKNTDSAAAVKKASEYRITRPLGLQTKMFRKAPPTAVAAPICGDCDINQPKMDAAHWQKMPYVKKQALKRAYHDKQKTASTGIHTTQIEKGSNKEKSVDNFFTSKSNYSHGHEVNTKGKQDVVSLLYKNKKSIGAIILKDKGNDGRFDKKDLAYAVLVHGMNEDLYDVTRKEITRLPRGEMTPYLNLLLSKDHVTKADITKHALHPKQQKLADGEWRLDLQLFGFNPFNPK